MRLFLSIALAICFAFPALAKVIVYQNEAGGISIIHPSSPNSTIEEMQRALPPKATYKIMDAAPTDRTFRDAWRMDFSKASSQITVDMETARKITRRQLADKSRLEETETGEKRAIPDVTKAATVEDLKVILAKP